ncbi:FAD-binding and (Fe-S)-binding domain-containing protein [Schleiferiaceae bacterium]|nr:FAD-binding and (Fe-S)-binding domain-containing protein [Schleiferiaceae bacterium]
MTKPSKELLKRTYAQDASIYQETPEAVAFPKSAEDVVALVRSGARLIPRAAGTSLAGQVVGDGTVLDTGRYMNAILQVNIEERWAEIQPGVVRDELNHHLKEHGLFFGPNTSTSNRCMMGGMVGNNSSGSTSISYGTTREKLLGLELVTADGVLRAMGDIQSDGVRDITSAVENWMTQWSEAWSAQNLESHFPNPSIHRRNTGYAIDLIGNDADALLQVMCGSEGTLGITTKIRVALDPLPPAHVAVVALHYHRMDEAMGATPKLMAAKPYQLELMDRIILECTRESKEYSSYREFVQGDPAAILLVEVRGSTKAELTENLAAFQCERSYARAELFGNDSDKVWKLRAAGLGLLSNLPGDAKPVACIEDTAVRIEVLQDYIQEFDQLMQGFGQESVYYAHAGAGELHLRPILNLKTSEGVRLLYEISKASAELVKKYGGSLSGEHGDGRVRAAFIKDFYGPEVYPWMESFKKAWDPENRLNPGKIVGAKPMEEDLRYEVNRKEPALDTQFPFSEEGGFLRAVEKCNGSGDCRRLPYTGALMCPSYMASRDEWDSTRGRANVLRSVLTEQSVEGFKAPELAEAMQHCVGCKGCTKECPSGVDMAAMKSEYLYQNRSNRGFADRAFANFHKSSSYQGLWRFINPILKSGVTKRLMGIHPERSVPGLVNPAYMKAYKKGYSVESASGHERAVILWVDEFTQANDPMLVGKACDVLGALGYSPAVVCSPSGRAALSGGFLPESKELAKKALKNLQNATKTLKNAPILGLEASAVLSAVDEYPRLLPNQKAWILEQKIATIDKFLADELPKITIPKEVFEPYEKEILLHVHCHQKSLESAGDTAYVLQLLLGAKVERVKSSCCGMAGSYGMKRENYEMSTKMAELVLLPKIEAFEGDVVVATGTSCRHQIQDLSSRKAEHLMDTLWAQLVQ